MVYDLSDISGKALCYITEERIQSSVFVQAQVTSCRIDVDMECSKDGEDTIAELRKEYFPDGTGNCGSRDPGAYEWIGIRSLICSEKPCCWVLSYEDFYTLEQYDDRNITCGAEDGVHYKKADFSLKHREVPYDGCRMLLLIDPPTEEGTQIRVYYRVPKGYDGCVLGFHNSAGLTSEQLAAGKADPAAQLGFIERTQGDLYIRLK